MGSVAIIAALQDGGAQEVFFTEYMNRFKGLSLHPLQFTELSCKVTCRAGLFDRIPKYINSEEQGTISVHQLPLGGLSSKPIFRDWENLPYARALSYRTGYPIEQIFVPPDKFRTWLYDDKGAVPFLDVDTGPWEYGDRLTRSEQIIQPSHRRRL